MRIGRLLTGGVSTGFSHVSNEHVPRLFSVKGKKSPVVRQLPAVSWEHMNDGDSFVLDLKEVIYVWNGRNANKHEKLQAAKVSRKTLSVRLKVCQLHWR